MSKYEVKNVKSFRGREGYGFNASLYRDGKRVAHVDDEGNGGCYRYHWLDWEAGRVEIPTTVNGKDFMLKVTREQKAFMEHVKAAGKYGDFEPEDSCVAELVDEYEANKQYKKWCKKSIVFRLKGDEEGKWRMLRAKYGDKRAVQFLKDKYGDKLEEILNERFAA